MKKTLFVEMTMDSRLELFVQCCLLVLEVLVDHPSRTLVIHHNPPNRNQMKCNPSLTLNENRDLRLILKKSIMISVYD